jgi:hypothetical protein
VIYVFQYADLILLFLLVCDQTTEEIDRLQQLSNRQEQQLRALETANSKLLSDTVKFTEVLFILLLQLAYVFRFIQNTVCVEFRFDQR